jgi:Kdo2-lipid IVA lauroyltransferase/acyltransferase
MSARPQPTGLRKIRCRTELAVFDGLLAIVGRLSARSRRRLACVLGTLVWALDVSHRRVARANVRLAYGDTLPEHDQRRLVRASMRHLVLVAIETLAVRTYFADYGDVTIVVQGEGHLRDAAASGRGVILATGHLGHWELLAIVGGRLGYPFTVIARPLDNPFLEARLLEQRSVSGDRVLDKHGAFAEARRILLDGGIIGTLFDQRPKRGGIPVPFFGVDAYVTDGLARLVLDTDAIVLPCFGVFETDGSARVTVGPPIPIAKTGDRMADAVKVSADCTAIIEQWVRRYPDQWLWTHRRWARPKPGDPRLAPPEDDREA